MSFSKPESLSSIYINSCSVQQTTDIPALIKHAQRISENKEKHILKVYCPIRNRAKTFEQHINLLTVSYSPSDKSSRSGEYHWKPHIMSRGFCPCKTMYFSRFLVLRVQWRRTIGQQRPHSAASTCLNMLPLQWSINTETLGAADLLAKSLIHISDSEEGIQTQIQSLVRSPVSFSELSATDGLIALKMGLIPQARYSL